MSERKRKRSERDSVTSNKFLSNYSGKIKVTRIGNSDELTPVITVPFGVSASEIPLKPYMDSSKNNVDFASRKLVLHSSQHPRMDFVATEDFGTGSDALMDHYLGIYDPETGELKLSKARQLALRSMLRPTAEQLQRDAEQKAFQTRNARRNALGMEFGNKKARRAIAVMTENAVQSGVDDQGNLTRASKVLLSAAVKSTKDMKTREEMAAEAQADKPRPKANLDATRPDQVYSIQSLIPPETLDGIRTQDWLSMHASGGLTFKSRYVARRVGNSCQNKDVMKIKVLKYMLACILFFKALKPGSKTRKLPAKAQLDAATEAADSFLVDSVRRRFCKTSPTEMTNWEADNMVTHLGAMALYIDGFSTDSHDLMLDLNLEPKKMTAYFMELGCKIGAMRQAERKAFGLTDADVKSRSMARLEIPLTFPIQRNRRSRN